MLNLKAKGCPDANRWIHLRVRNKYWHKNGAHLKFGLAVATQPGILQQLKDIMKIPMPVSAVLAQKGPMVVFIQSDATVFDAIAVMSEKNVGALPVLEKGRLVGMISERDYTRKIALKGKLSKETSVQEIMSRQVSVAKSDDSIEECMRLMTDKHVRHLPIMEGDKMIGLVSIGDLVKWIISVQAETIEQLQKYIAGSYPA